MNETDTNRAPEELAAQEIPPRCPKCLATGFAELPGHQRGTGKQCRGCQAVWHESDLIGERFEYLESVYHQAAP